MIFDDMMFLILIVAVLTDLLIPVVLGFRYPGYNHFHDTISILGTNESPVKKQESLNLIIVGILFIVFALGQRYMLKNVEWSHILYVFGIVVFGISCVFAGIYPEDPKGVEETVSENKEAGLLKYTGLFQRLNLIVLYGCLFLNFMAMKTID